MNLRVLLVDDDPERAAQLKAALRAAGYEVAAHVDSAADLLAQVRRRRPARAALSQSVDSLRLLRCGTAVAPVGPCPCTGTRHGYRRAT